MKWIKKGLLFNPKNKFYWATSHALQPTPFVLDDKIRVFSGFRDDKGQSRIGFVDLDKNNPTEIISLSERPILDLGEPGCFDEHGVVPSAIVKNGSQIFLFYAGYQIGHGVRFSVLGGLAISNDGGQTFTRARRVPVFERTEQETLFRVPHTVLLENDIWKAWYGGGDHFIYGVNKSLPVYDIRYTESQDPYHFSTGRILLETSGDEYRLGRPFVLNQNGMYYMFYGFSTENAPYKLGYATSSDLISWERKDEQLGLDLSASGWDSQMMAYPAIIQSNEKTYMLYNGNNYGEEGFGLAELLQW